MPQTWIMSVKARLNAGLTIGISGANMPPKSSVMRHLKRSAATALCGNTKKLIFKSFMNQDGEAAL